MNDLRDFLDNLRCSLATSAIGADDAELLARFASDRDDLAFAELVARHGPMVLGVCRRRLSASDAEDAFQATFLVLARKAAHLQRRPCLAPWLHRVALLTIRNLSRRTARREAGRQALRDDLHPATKATEVSFDIDAALATLPSRYREVLILCHLQGRTRAEAAALLRRPEGTISTELALTVTTLPAGVAMASARSAIDFLTHRSATTSPSAILATGVLKMIRIKKLTTLFTALCMIFALSIGAMTMLTPNVSVNAEEPSKKSFTKKEDDHRAALTHLAREWRLIHWANDTQADASAVFSLAVEDGKVLSKPKTQKWGRTVSDIEYTDGVLRFKVTYDAKSDNLKANPLHTEWFEGRFHPKNRDRICGVFGSKDPSKDGDIYGTLRAAELDLNSDVPKDPLQYHQWAMPRATSQGINGLQYELSHSWIKMRQGKEELTADEVSSAVRHYMILEELASHRKADRRGFVMLCMLVSNAKWGDAIGNERRVADAEWGHATPKERVENWIVEILQFADAYGPRYMKQLRMRLALDLENQKENEYKSIIKRLRADGDFVKNPPEEKK
jgi:RNA polymerase sigma factor (sigma-70 family)